MIYVGKREMWIVLVNGFVDYFNWFENGFVFVLLFWWLFYVFVIFKFYIELSIGV